MGQFCNEAVASAIKYEIEMFQFLCKELALEKVGTGGEPLNDALLESLLLHVRVLMEFFYRPKKRQPDDVLAADFVDGWSEQEGMYLKGLREPLNKLLAHLTLKREEYSIHGFLWDVYRLHDEIQPTIDKFLDKMPDDRQPWFQ